MSELEGESKNEGMKTSRDAFKYCNEKNLDCIYPMANELFVDIDTEADYGNFLKNKNIISIIKAWHVTPSRTKAQGKHIVVELDRDVTSIERIALQTILGSDTRREAHSWVRLQANDPLPTLFFEKKKKKIVEEPYPSINSQE
jgi:hypothetical protein